MYLFLEPFRDYPIAVILLGVVVGSAVEYVYGFAVLRFFRIRVWDYKDEKHNYERLIAPFYSCMWGIMAPLFIYVLSPAITPFLLVFDEKISVMLLLLMAIDLVFTVNMLIEIAKGKSAQNYLCPVLKRA